MKRAATRKYSAIRAGDAVILICGKKRIEKRVKKVKIFRSIAAIMKKYKPTDINPKTHTIQEARAMWHSFPGYKEKIAKHGLIAISLE